METAGPHDERIEQVNRKSEELIAELREHEAEVRASFAAEGRSTDIDPRKVFEGWAIQKIASLQVLVLEHVERLERLEQQRRDR